MSTTHTPRSYTKAHPIKTGLFVVLGVLALGTASAFALGYGAPQPAEAFTPVSSVTVVGAATAASSVTSVASTIAATTAVVNSVVSNVVTTVSTLDVQGHRNDNDSGNNNTPSVTDANGVTTVSEVVGIGQLNSGDSNDNPSTEPCCTEPTPAISVTPPAAIDNPFTLPCCTVPTTSVTTPSVPIVITPQVVTIVDICINIDGVQTTVPGGMTTDGSGNCTPPLITQATVICTLTASASVITPGQGVTLTWTTQNATSFDLNQGIGAVTPTSGGSRVVYPTGNTTYVGTASGPGGPVTCSAPVTVTTVSSAPICTLTASASSVTPGSTVTLSWTTANVSSASIDNGVGAATPVGSGSRSVVVNANTTYTLTGIGTNGQTVTCSAPVTVVPVQSPSPICTLTASASSVTPGSTVTLSWTTANVSSASIDNGVGAATPVGSGSRSVVVNANTTYTLTGIGTNGQTVTCSAPVTVVPVQSPSPICTLTASASSVTPGSTVTLSWTTSNVSSASIDNGVGAATPVGAGSRSVVVNANTTYTLTGIGTNGQTVTCSAPVTLPPPICTLSASAGTVAPGTSVNLVYSTTNVSSASIDNGVGNLNPVTGGTRSVIVNADTTYTLTGTGTNGQPVTCAAPVRVSTGGGGSPICTLTASPTSIKLGDSATITWGGNRIVSVSIDNGIGAVSGVSGSTTVTPPSKGTYTYIGSFLATNGSTLTCQATIEVTGGGGGCTSNCGGGGGSSKPRVVLSSLKTPGDQPLAFVYLSQIPYTGLDLGPLGTALYWTMLMLWSLAAAYLILFNGLPFAFRKVGSFGSNVKEVLKQPVAVSTHTVTTHHAPAATASHAPAHHAAPSHTASHEHATPAEAPKGYQAYQAQEGFRSFASGGALSIDDIVKGLAREAEARPTATAHDIHPNFLVETSTEHGEPSHHVYVAMDAPAQIQTATVEEAPVAVAAPAPVVTPVNEDVRTFIAALLSGDRDTVFGTIRGITRMGGDSEAFLTHAVCALDDAYRSRVDGSACHPDIAAVTADCHPSFLERVVTALTTAVDGSYSTGVTGVKLALTRALAVVNG